MRGLRDAIVVIPGTRWEDTQGTDHRLAQALSEHCQVLWVDPPVPFAGPARVLRPAGAGFAHLDQLQESIIRLRYLVAPGFTRPGLDRLAKALRDAAMLRAQRRLGLRVQATLLLSPRDEFPAGSTGERLLHVTDDWVQGAAMMGLGPRQVRRRLAKNLAAADQVSAVSPYLEQVLHEVDSNAVVQVVPNGCTVLHPQGQGSGPAPEPNGKVVLLGQLNERLDMEVLKQLAASGLPIEVIGPRRERGPVAVAGLDRFLAAENVHWHGEVAPGEVPALLAGAMVGITPYLDNEFNRASFPLKTLDYLAAGLAVVSTDSPAVRWLDTPFIRVAGSPEHFVELAGQLAAGPAQGSERQQRIDFANGHSWQARAASLIGRIKVQS
ncbi:glycosyltransferase [Glutamicibacter sp. NPDC087673]|uniref:glycosyltransferase n=1 Tax=Glutamicibacter sp. NPDC087673 TaxID=3363997 RepID=UPI003821AAB1